jgi:hypothetical protein
MSIGFVGISVPWLMAINSHQGIRRQELLKAALKVMKRDGLRSATVDKIAKRQCLQGHGTLQRIIANASGRTISMHFAKSVYQEKPHMPL